MMLKKGVTITEILIVIGILALLFALLFPSLTPLKEHTKFYQKIAYTGELLTEQRMKSQGGYTIEQNPTQTRKALGIRIKNATGNQPGGVYAIWSDLSPSADPLLQQSIQLKNIFEEPYNVFSDDTFFSKTPNLPPLARIEQLSFVQSTQNTPLDEIDILYLPNSNDVRVLNKGTLLPGGGKITFKSQSLRNENLTSEIALFPSTATLQRLK